MGKTTPNSLFIAHKRADGKEQPLADHLTDVGSIASGLASKTDLDSTGEIIGLLHDFGEYSTRFQTYLGSATGKINPDEDGYVEFKKLKGRIDHSSAGAQWIWNHCRQWEKSSIN